MASTRTEDFLPAGGFQHVFPYLHLFSTRVKKEWDGMRVEDVIREHFSASCPPEYLADFALPGGWIQVDGRPVLPGGGRDDVLREGQALTHLVHRHEPPVVSPPSTAAAPASASSASPSASASASSASASASATCWSAMCRTAPDGVLVVNKPPSWPVYPTGAYRKNSLLHILGLGHHHHQQQSAPGPGLEGGRNASGEEAPAHAAAGDAALPALGEDGASAAPPWPFPQKKRAPQPQKKKNRRRAPDEPGHSQHLLFRLDRLTSGLILLGPTPESARAYHKAGKRDVSKVYLAVVAGRLEAPAAARIAAARGGGADVIAAHLGKPEAPEAEAAADATLDWRGAAKSAGLRLDSWLDSLAAQRGAGVIGAGAGGEGAEEEGGAAWVGMQPCELRVSYPVRPMAGTRGRSESGPAVRKAMDEIDGVARPSGCGAGGSEDGGGGEEGGEGGGGLGGARECADNEDDGGKGKVGEEEGAKRAAPAPAAPRTVKGLPPPPSAALGYKDCASAFYPIAYRTQRVPASACAEGGPGIGGGQHPPFVTVTTTLVLARPITGRTHQLRLHLQALGHPIANDPVYGWAKSAPYGEAEAKADAEAKAEAEAGAEAESEAQRETGRSWRFWSQDPRGTVPHMYHPTARDALSERVRSDPLAGCTAGSSGGGGDGGEGDDAGLVAGAANRPVTAVRALAELSRAVKRQKQRAVGESGESAGGGGGEEEADQGGDAAEALALARAVISACPRCLRERQREGAETDEWAAGGAGGDADAGDDEEAEEEGEGGEGGAPVSGEGVAGSATGTAAARPRPRLFRTGIFLHAASYSTDRASYHVPPPEWALGGLEAGGLL